MPLYVSGVSFRITITFRTMATMWWKLFKRGSEKAAPSVRPSDARTPHASSNLGGALKGKGNKPAETSFDPYNSGAFDRKKNAWDRVTRK